MLKTECIYNGLVDVFYESLVEIDQVVFSLVLHTAMKTNILTAKCVIKRFLGSRVQSNNLLKPQNIGFSLAILSQ